MHDGIDGVTEPIRFHPAKLFELKARQHFGDQTPLAVEDAHTKSI
jgi:hypothetical protein